MRRMKSIFFREWKSGFKTLLIWAAVVGGMGFACILLYKSMEGTMEEMAESFASMGSFADAFGMSTLSIATVKGFFATEVGTMHAIGGAMFAASIASVLLSKEEDSHTAEFTYTLPVKREKIIVTKYLVLVANIAVFTAGCGMLYGFGFLVIGESGIAADLTRYLFFQFLMNLEITSVCFLFSACSRKNKMGVGIGIAMVLYLFDLIARVLPDLKKAIFLTPFSFSNAAEIMAGLEIDTKGLVVGVCVLMVSAISAYFVYSKRDLAS